ncbi:hypothetical protein BCR44DRAFT_33994 [Catenaria anguillulae PL171]|uniref:Erythromycin biosynthesis protein CIII-like C-terminal domain-containing protein n=1 Tax=Catenaria anguillulae PL171 TaxID=765915 RepID=A0A1Y2HUB5_9FUNG|nr:hypothetical protein BCR44DRAFT_33994 [Catenaria anguillulae PL171]
MPYSILIPCIGTRGDVQPFLALAMGLTAAYPRGTFRFVIGTHKDYLPFVESHKEAASISDTFVVEPSISYLLKESPIGKQMKQASIFSKMSTTKSFMQEMHLGWTRSIKAALDQHGPFDLLMLPTFAAQCGTLAIVKAMPAPAPRILILHTVPSYPCSDFAPPTAGVGGSAPFAFLNSIMWSMGMRMVHNQIMYPVTAEVCKDVGVPHWPTASDLTSAVGMEKDWAIGHIYSKNVLPRPATWPENHQVIGFLDYKPPPSKKDHDGLPDDLAKFMDAPESANLPVVYVGLGSMLWVAFDSDDEAKSILQRLYSGLVAATAPPNPPKFRAILHTVAGPNGQHFVPETMTDGVNVFLLNKPVPHDLLFPRCALTVHHGGAGTLHTSLLHGCPSVIYACAKSTDQPFWAGIVAKAGMGVDGGMVHGITVKSVAATVTKAVEGVKAMREKVEKVKEEMKKESAVGWVKEWIGPIPK